MSEYERDITGKRFGLLVAIEKVGSKGGHAVWKFKWVPKVMVNYKNIWLGAYDDKEEAIKARLAAEKKYFGEFAPQEHLFEKYGVV